MSRVGPGGGRSRPSRAPSFITDTPIAQFPSPEWDGVREFEDLMVELESDIRRVMAWRPLSPHRRPAPESLAPIALQVIQPEPLDDCTELTWLSTPPPAHLQSRGSGNSRQDRSVSAPIPTAAQRAAARPLLAPGRASGPARPAPAVPPPTGTGPVRRVPSRYTAPAVGGPVRRPEAAAAAGQVRRAVPPPTIGLAGTFKPSPRDADSDLSGNCMRRSLTWSGGTNAYQSMYKARRDTIKKMKHDPAMVAPKAVRPGRSPPPQALKGGRAAPEAAAGGGGGGVRRVSPRPAGWSPPSVAFESISRKRQQYGGEAPKLAARVPPPPPLEELSARGDSKLTSLEEARKQRRMQREALSTPSGMKKLARLETAKQWKAGDTKSMRKNMFQTSANGTNRAYLTFPSGGRQTPVPGSAAAAAAAGSAKKRSKTTRT